MTILDVVIVGAGQSGLGISYQLNKKGLSHVVFERGRIGETWRSQRWESFQTQHTQLNELPARAPDGGERPLGIGRVEELVSYFQRYVETFHLPVPHRRYGDFSRARRGARSLPHQDKNHRG